MEQMKFFIYMIESPSPVDLYNNITESVVLKSIAILNHIPFTSRTTINLETFRDALSIGLSEVMQENSARFPVIHLSMHGSSEGLKLSSGEIILWNNLRELLIPINKAFLGNLLLSISACEGYAGIRMAMNKNNDDPFFALLGCVKNPTWAETAIAYATFYHLIASGKTLYDASLAIQTASGNDGFYIDTAAEARNAYLKSISEQNILDAEKQIRRETRQQDNKT